MLVYIHMLQNLDSNENKSCKLYLVVTILSSDYRYNGAGSVWPHPCLSRCMRGSWTLAARGCGLGRWCSGLSQAQASSQWHRKVLNLYGAWKVWEKGPNYTRGKRGCMVLMWWTVSSLFISFLLDSSLLSPVCQRWMNWKEELSLRGPNIRLCMVVILKLNTYSSIGYYLYWLLVLPLSLLSDVQ